MSEPSEPTRSVPQPSRPVGVPTTGGALFGGPKPEPAAGASSLLPWVIAGAVVLLVALGLVLATHRKPAAASNGSQGPDAYAANLAVGDLQMSESTSLSGGKSTFVDGHVRNTGTKIVTSATVQVQFANDMQLPPQTETLPLALIRTHEPYVDTEPVSAEPLKPGDEREFRLIFEDIGANWNQSLPVIRVLRVETR